MRGRDFSKKGSIDELSILLRGEKKCFSHPLCTRGRNDGKNNRKSVKNCWKSPLTFLIISRRDLISRRWMRLNFHYERSKAGTILNSLLKSSDKRCFIFILLLALFFSFPFSTNPTLNKRDKNSRLISFSFLDGKRLENVEKEKYGPSSCTAETINSYRNPWLRFQFVRDSTQRHIRLDDLYGCQPNGSTLNRGKLIVNMHRGEIPFIDCRYIRRGLTTWRRVIEGRWLRSFWARLLVGNNNALDSVNGKSRIG